MKLTEAEKLNAENLVFVRNWRIEIFKEMTFLARVTPEDFPTINTHDTEVLYNVYVPESYAKIYGIPYCEKEKDENYTNNSL